MILRLILLVACLVGQVSGPTSPPYNPPAEYAAAIQARTAGQETRAREILQAIIARDPSFAPAWQALGYEKIGEIWVLVNTRGPASPATIAGAAPLPIRTTSVPAADNVSGSRPTPSSSGFTPVVRTETVPASQPASAPTLKARQALWKQIQTAYAQQIKAIRQTSLAAGGEIFERGRQRLLALRDPLAIAPLCEELSVDKDPRIRKLLVGLLETCAGQSRNQATLNLIALSVLDESPEVRLAAINVLFTRTDAQIEQALRLGLQTNDEDLLANAAFALGRLRARTALPDLVKVLQPGPKPGPLKVADWIRQAELLFNHASDETLPAPKICYVWPPAYDPARKPQPTPNVRNVVQEALIAISGGKNYGFDKDAWLKWDRETP